MTREEAIKFLNEQKEFLLKGCFWEETRMNINEAFDMAIEALEADAPDTNVGDTISRQAAIDEVVAWLKDRMTDGKNEKPLTERLKDLPSAQPEITVEDVTKYCQERGYVIVDRELYEDMITVWKDHCCADTERRTDG